MSPLIARPTSSRPPHTRRSWLARLALCGLLLSLAACGFNSGSGGGGGTGDGGDGGGNPPPPPAEPFWTTAPVTVAGKVVLPEGFAGTPDQMLVTTIAGDQTPAADGSVEVPTYLGGPQLALVTDADGDVLLAGWVPPVPGAPGPTEISARSTAEVLLFFGLMAGMQDDAVTADVVRRLHEEPALDGFGKVISDAIAADPKALVNVSASLNKSLQDTIAWYRPFGRPTTRKLGIDPTDERSGLQVRETGINEIRISNVYRRRVVVFVERTSFRKDGVTTPFEMSLGRFEIPSAFTVTSLTGIVKELAIQVGTLAAGQLPTNDVEIGPIATPLEPAEADLTNYRVICLGAGNPLQGGAAVSELNFEQKAAFVEVVSATVLLDMVLPVLANAWAPQVSKENKGWIGGGADAVAGVVGILKDNVQGYFEAVSAGDAKGAAILVWEALLHDSNVRNLVGGALAELLLPELGINPSNAAQRGAALTDKLMKFFSAWDRLLTVADTLAQVSHVGMSRPVQIFDIFALRSRVTLTPDEVTISDVSPPPVFQARVPDATNDEAPLIKYHWTCTGQFGHLVDGSDALHSGNDFENSSGLVSYAWDSGEGSDTITVEAYVDGVGGQPDQLLGTATATVNVRNAVVTITPEEIELSAGDASTFVAKVDAPTLPAGTPLSYRWTCSGGHGTFTIGADTFEDAAPAATYRVWLAEDGEDTVSVEAFADLDGVKVSLGTADATVTVTKDRPKTRVVYGSGHADGWQIIQDGWISGGAGFGVFIPKVEGAVSYAVSCYGFNDPHYWGTSRSAYFTPENPYGVGEENTQYTLGFSGGAWFGPAPAPDDEAGLAAAEAGLQNSIAGYAARFAGMIVKVTVTLEDEDE